ncbi:hypothetical protein [Bythopirellula polymerisocia]|uniref:TraB family protein n=1 Tax=Bythopirellula polymerisocia TaxID=2528003 RepID=A0A5C6CFN2_9BACT|nr:hypothetical protein [Bythopirellula polymerisocia]TWU23723.1 hypothetical protein Pla144_38980 [Bythopirellula polymerisocia]
MNISLRFPLRLATALLVCLPAAWVAWLTVPGSVQAKPAVVEAEPALGEEWVRVSKDENGDPTALEVAIVRYLPAKLAKQYRQAKPTADLPPARQYVDLIGAVHVGDSSYYTQLNRRFRQYQALLYELVAPPGTRVERGRGTSNLHPVGALQNSMKSLLEVEHQLEQVDYTRPNFVHADMSPEEFASSMSNRNESFMQMYTRMMGQAIALQTEQAAQGESTDFELFTAMFSEDRPRMLKTAIAKQFQSMESVLTGMSGPEGSTLITERNKRALEVLRKQLRSGKQKIGIFYGAGHLTDMHERLVKDFGYEPVGIVWLEAWNLREKP